MKQDIRNVLLILILSVILGYLLMTAVYAIPLNWTGELREQSIREAEADGGLIFEQRVYLF